MDRNGAAVAVPLVHDGGSLAGNDSAIVSSTDVSESTRITRPGVDEGTVD
jgi:hypothetical protein